MTTSEVLYGDFYTEKGMEVFRRMMKHGVEEVYFKEARKILARNLSPIIYKDVIGEAQFLLHLEHGWKLESTDSPSYGQLFRHRHMTIPRDQLVKEVQDHEHHIIA